MSTYWVRPPQVLSADGRAHRFVWDLHYTAAGGAAPRYPIAAVYRDTPREPLGPAVVPGAIPSSSPSTARRSSNRCW